MSAAVNQSKLLVGDASTSGSSAFRMNDAPYDHRLLFDIPVPADTSMFGAFQILLNTAIGSGALMFPYCYTCGVALSPVISLRFGFFAYLSMHFMISAAHTTRKYDYHGLFEQSLGSRHLWLLHLMIVLVQFGAMMIYVHWIGRLFNMLIRSSNLILGSNVFWTFLAASCVIFPIVLFRSISKLEHFASFSTVFILLLIVHSLYWLFKDMSDRGWIFPPGEPKMVMFSRWKVIISAFGVNCMAFNCHMNFFSCLESLKHCTLNRARTLGSLTMATSFVLYNLLGLSAYLDMPDKIGSKSVLEYYDSTNVFTIITLAGVILILVVSSPIVCWAGRRSLNLMLFKEKPMTPPRWVGLGGLCVIIAAFLASTSDNVIIFFDLAGGLFTPILILMFPALFYLRTAPIGNRSRVMIGLAVASCCLTVIGAAACTFRAVQEIISVAKSG
jgi:amino acid permease